MKRALFVVAVLVLVVLFLLLLDAQDESTTLTLDENSVPTVTPVVSDLGESTESGDTSTAPDLEPSRIDHPPIPSDTRAATVARLADGDSFDIVWTDTGEVDEVRLFGINAPEGGACFGDAARGVLQVLTDSVSLQVQSIERDEFGRVLGNVWVGDLLVNATMVELGAALALSDGGSHAELIAQAQSVAREEQSGLWDPAFCGADPDAQVRIAWIESDAPGQDNLNRNGEWIVIENAGQTDTDLTDWSIRDESTRHRYFFPDGFVLSAGDDVQVYSGCGDDSASELYWCDEDPVWNNRGDTGFLVDADGKFVDTRSYGG